jgi:tetratricopeptide (TPR) repeat protein
VYSDTGKTKRAENLFHDVLQAMAAQLGAEDGQTLKTKNNLALFYLNQGDYNRAEPLFREALQAWTAKDPADSTTSLAMKHNLADAYRLQEKYALAAPLFEEVIKACKQGADFPGLQDTKYRLAIVYLNQEKYAQAEPLLREVLEAWTKGAPDAWETFSSESMLGHALWGQQKFADAESLLIEGYRGLKQREAQIPADGKHKLTEALDRLVNFYDATGKKDAAARWRKELEPGTDNGASGDGAKQQSR